MTLKSFMRRKARLRKKEEDRITRGVVSLVEDHMRHCAGYAAGGLPDSPRYRRRIEDAVKILARKYGFLDFEIVESGCFLAIRYGAKGGEE